MLAKHKTELGKTIEENSRKFREFGEAEERIKTEENRLKSCIAEADVVLSDLEGIEAKYLPAMPASRWSPAKQGLYDKYKYRLNATQEGEEMANIFSRYIPMNDQLTSINERLKRAISEAYDDGMKDGEFQGLAKGAIFSAEDTVKKGSEDMPIG